MPKFAPEADLVAQSGKPQWSNLALPYNRLTVPPTSVVAEPSAEPATADATAGLTARQLRASRTPRPANAWIVFRKANVAGMVAQMEHEIAHSDSPELGVGQAEVSKRLGKIWKGLSDEEKRPYFEQAEVEKEMHAAKYPNYVFAPRRPRAKVLAGALPRVPALEPRKFTLAPPVRSSAPTPETYAQRDPTPVVAWAPPAQQPTMPAMRTERAFDLSQEIYAPRPMRAPQGISVFEALQATPPQQVPEPVFHYMQQLDQSQPLNEKKSSIEDWRLNVTEDRPSPRDELPFDELFDDYPEQQAFNDAPVVQSHHSNRAPEQRGFVASTPYYRSNEVAAYHSSQVAQDVVYHSASSASSPASGATTLSSALYPTPTPSPPRRPNFQLNDWNAPEYRYY